MSTSSLILYQYPDILTKKSASSAKISKESVSVILSESTATTATTATAATNVTTATTTATTATTAKINYQLRVNIITQYKENHLLGSCLIDDIIQFKWSRWKYNRPPDMIRVKEIVEYIDRKNSIDWLLYFIYSSNSKDKMASLFVYDGLHRMSAIGEYIKQFEKQQNIRCPLRDCIILISIKINPTDGEIVDAFKSINQSVPLPELYTVEHIKRDIIEKVVNKWQHKYSCHFRPASRTNVPNINRDAFIDIVSKVYELCDINEDTKKLEKVLNKINDYMQQNIHILPNITYTENALNKCKESGCYIFLVKSTRLFDFIEDHSHRIF